MFELRLGAKLGKSLGEVRALPYPEYKLWQTYYILEPFGFENIELQVARILSLIYNVNVKKSDRKKLSFWIRDMKSLVLNAISKEKEKRISYKTYKKEDLILDNMERRKEATERVIEGFKAMFGQRVKDKR